MDTYKNILVVRRDNIGDLVCTTPLITALRKHFPLARVGVLANSYNAPILAGNKDIDDVYAYRKLKHRADRTVISAVAARVSQLWTLRRKRFDLAVIAGGVEDHRGEALAKLVCRGKIAYSESPATGQHEVERAFSAARHLGIEGPIPPLSLAPDEKELAHVRTELKQAGLANAKPLVGMHVSARRPAQRWSAEGFADLAISLHEEHGAKTMLFWSPGPSDHPEHPGDDLKAKRIVDLVAGKAPLIAWPTSELPTLIGGIAACDSVVCSDGGAMHIAAALGKPIVCFFGDSPVARWRPWGVPHIVLQPESHQVSTLTVREISSAFALLLAQSPP